MRDVMRLMALAAVVGALATCGISSPTAGPQPAAGVAPAAVAGGSDWPQYRGPQGTGMSPETGINKNWAAKPPKLLWKVDMGDEGFAGPSVADGIVYIIDHSGDQDIVKALSLADGQEVWHYAYADIPQANYGFARSTPTVNGGKVYTMSRIGVLNCLNAKTGKLVWSKDVIKEFGGKRPGWDLAGSPLIDGNKVVVMAGGSDAAMVALDKATGATIWKGGGSAVPGYSTPVIATIGGVRQYVVMFAKGVMGVDTQGGKLLWTAPWQTMYDVNAANVIAIGNSVYVSSGYGHGCAVFDVSGSSATMRWQNKDLASQFSSALLVNGMIYGSSDKGNLMCLDPKTGQVAWSQPGFQQGGMVGVDGTIIALNGSNGDIIMARLDPAAYKELGRLQGPLGGRSWTAPIVARGRLIIRNNKALACLDLK